MKTVLITGASRGIGRACARTFAEHGFALVLNCRSNRSMLEELCTELEQACDIPVMISRGDVGDEDYVSDLFDEAENMFGAVDVLINNAGIAHFGLLQDLSLDEWNRILTTNLTSQFLCCRKAIPLMLRRHCGSIVNISSVWGSHGASCEAAYSASKGGVHAFTKALARELAPSGIRVNAASLGVIDTDMNRILDPSDIKALCGEIPAGRIGTPQEAAALIYALAVNHPYLTGQIVTLDGGWM